MAIKQIDYFGKSFTISYEMIQNQSEKCIVFLHGWGSNKEIMKQAFSKYLPELIHIYIDMPGFGKSQNHYVLTTKDYANIVQIFLEKGLNIKIDQSIIVGHSFGGKVATYLQPNLLVLLSSAGMVEKKSLKTKIKIKIAKLLKVFGLSQLGKFLRSKDVDSMPQNMYETFKNVVDEDFTKLFAQYENKALVFWGEKDTATSLESGKKIQSLIKQSQFYSYDGDHYFFSSLCQRNL